jgi:hypothetical protein
MQFQGKEKNVKSHRKQVWPGQASRYGRGKNPWRSSRSKSAQKFSRALRWGIQDQQPPVNLPFSRLCHNVIDEPQAKNLGFAS